MNTPQQPVTAAEIAGLTAWMRRLSQTGAGRIDPTELAAFHLAKASLFARIDDQHTLHAATPSTARPTVGKDTR